MSARLEQIYYRFLAKVLAFWVLLNDREAQLARHIDMWSKMAPTSYRYRLAESLQPWLAVQYNRVLCTYCGWAHESVEIHTWCQQQQGQVVFYSIELKDSTVVLTPSDTCEGTIGRPLMPGIDIYSVYVDHPYDCTGYAIALHPVLTMDLVLTVISADLKNLEVKFADAV